MDIPYAPFRDTFEAQGSINDPEQLDTQLKRIYLYYSHQGFRSLVIEKVVNLCIHLLLIFLCLTLLCFVHYDRLTQSIPENTPLSHFFDFSASRVPVILWIFLSGLLAVWILNFIQFIRDIPDLFAIRRFYRERLNIEKVSEVDWNLIVDRLSIAFNLDSLSITARIMRRDNYIISMVNKGILGVEKNSWSSLVFNYSKPFEWSLSYSVFSYLFLNDTVNVELLNRDYRVYASEKLRVRMIIVGCLLLLLSPVILGFLLTYNIFIYFDQIRSTPSILGGRTWSRYAVWKFRNLNELPHYFSDRMIASSEYTQKFLGQFPNHLLPILLHLPTLIFGALLTLLIFFSFLNNDFLVSVILFDRSLLYYVGGLGLALTGIRALIPNNDSKSDPQKYLSRVIEYTQYSPKSWLSDVHSAKEEIDSLYSYRLLIFLQAMLSVVTGPIFLIFFLSKRSDEIIGFLQDFTIYDNNLGYICSLSSFSRLEYHGNQNYGTVTENNKTARTRHGKLEKSIITFAVNNPKWIPPDDCQSLIRNLQAESELNPVGNFRVNQPENFRHSELHEEKRSLIQSLIAHRHAHGTNEIELNPISRSFVPSDSIAISQ